MNEDASKTVYADSFSFGPSDAQNVFAVQQDGWEWVRLPKPTLRQRLSAWWHGKELPTEELRPKMVIGIRRDLIAGGSINVNVDDQTCFLIVNGHLVPVKRSERDAFAQKAVEDGKMVIDPERRTLTYNVPQ